MSSCKPFTSQCILLKKNVEGKGESDKQGCKGGEKDKRLAEHSEEDVEVNSEVGQVAQPEKQGGPSKQDRPGREMGVDLVHHLWVTHIGIVWSCCHHKNNQEE